MVSAVCLIVLCRQVWGFIQIGEKLSFTQMNDLSVYWNWTFEFLTYYAEAVLTAIASLMAVLISSTINVSLLTNTPAINLCRIYLITMFLVIVIDLLLLTGHAYFFWSHFFS